MPQPKPRPDETEEEFHSRCMSDDVMEKEYPDQEQRNAVCYNIWDRYKKENSSDQ